MVEYDKYYVKSKEKITFLKTIKTNYKTGT